MLIGVMLWDDGYRKIVFALGTKLIIQTSKFFSFHNKLLKLIKVQISMFNYYNF